jgi:Family of unknown function (DUF5908)
MPIEIRELHIRVSVGEDAKQGAGVPAQPVGDGHADKDAIVAECVEQVMQILQVRKER